MSKSAHSKDLRALLALLREMREGAGVTQVELAERLGQPQSFVSKCETGERRLDVLELRQWCSALGGSVVELVKSLERKVGRVDKSARLNGSSAPKR